MKPVLLITLMFIVGSVIGYRGLEKIIYKKTFQKEVLSDSIDSSQNVIPTPSPLLTPTDNPTPTQAPLPTILLPTKIPTPTIIPLPTIAPQQVHAFIERFASQYGIDPNVLRHIAVCESGFNPAAINGKYTGLFQFASNTWRSNRIIMGEDPNPDLRLNPEESVQTAAYMISIGRGDIWPNCYPH